MNSQRGNEWPTDKLSIEVPGSAKPGFTSIFRNRLCPEVEVTNTAYDLFSQARDRSPNTECCGQRPWDFVKGDFAPKFEWYTYAEIEELRTALGSGLTQLVKEGRLGKDLPLTDWCGAYWTNNKPEFQVLFQANNAFSRRTVAIYDSFDAENAGYILAHSEARVVFTTSIHFHKVLSKASELPHLKVLVLLDKEPPVTVGTTNAGAVKLPPGQLQMEQVAASWAKEKGIEVIKYADLINYGRQHLHAHIPPTSIDAICM